MTYPIIKDLGDFRVVEWPACSYIEATGDTPVTIDNGGRHLGEPCPGVAVPFPTIRHGELHKHFGIVESGDGSPMAYGKGAVLTAESQPHEYLSAAKIGAKVSYKGNVYTIRETANQNIALEPVVEAEEEQPLDAKLIDHGSLVILESCTPAANEWIEDHIPDDAQTWGTGIVIEPRYVDDIVQGMQSDGLTIGMA